MSDFSMISLEVISESWIV